MKRFGQLIGLKPEHYDEYVKAHADVWPGVLAKIAGILMCKSYNRQHGTNFIAAMPTNLYGPGDNFDLESSHVIPAMIRNCSTYNNFRFAR